MDSTHCLQLTILKQAIFARKQRAIRNALIIGDQIMRWALYIRHLQSAQVAECCLGLTCTCAIILPAPGWPMLLCCAACGTFAPLS